MKTKAPPRKAKAPVRPLSRSKFFLENKKSVQPWMNLASQYKTTFKHHAHFAQPEIWGSDNAMNLTARCVELRPKNMRRLHKPTRLPSVV